MANSLIDGPQSRVNEGANKSHRVGWTDPTKECRRGKGNMRIGTWNVRTMQKRGKLETIKREMSRNRLNILGLSEVQWKDSRDLISDGIRMICTAAKQDQGGIAILLDRETSMRVTKIVLQNDHLLLVKIQAEPADLVIIQVYMPTSTHEDNEVEEMYEQLDCLIKAENGNTNLMVMGDWNCIIGEGQDEKEVGTFGLGTRNERDFTFLSSKDSKNILWND